MIPTTGQTVAAVDAHGGTWTATVTAPPFRGTSLATADTRFALLDFGDGQPPIPWPCDAMREVSGER